MKNFDSYPVKPRIASACLRIASGAYLLISLIRWRLSIATMSMIDIWVYAFLAIANFAWAENELKKKE